MRSKPRTPEQTYGPALRKAERAFAGLEPHEAALRAAVSYQITDDSGSRFSIPFFGQVYLVSWPRAAVQRMSDQYEPDVATRILLLHYLLTSDGTPMSNRWIAFRSLPGGLGYDAAFRKRSGVRLARAFGDDPQGFCRAAGTLGGEALTFGDASFLFRALPRVWLAVVLHVADEEFPADANVLLDATASHYLPTEDLAVLGGILAARLIKAAQDHEAVVSETIG